MLPIVITKPVYIHKGDCGYCHGQKTERYATQHLRTMLENQDSQSVTIGMDVQLMTCDDYDQFINMGFRRSGTMLYKTDMLRNCCRYYTIRTNLSYFKTTKKHRQVINRFVRAISDENPAKEKHHKGTPFDINCLVEAERKSSRFSTRFEKSVFTKEKYELYKKYQIKVHNDDPEELSEKLFERFLCKAPFPDEEKDGELQEWEGLHNWRDNQTIPSTQRIGPTHECYYLDGKLIAISIMDFLPSGISSIYFIWDPDYAHLSLGTLSGLRELLMIEKLGLQYYYLGYYIQDCTKMVYKGAFGGEILDLCNETYYPLEDVDKDVTNSLFFAIGQEASGEIPMKFEYPQSKKKTNTQQDIVELIYNDSTFSDAERAASQLESLVKLDPESFPLVVPGLMPVSQLKELITQKYDSLRVSILDGITGELYRRVLFSSLDEEEKQVVAETLRLFGPKRLQRMIIINY